MNFKHLDRYRVRGGAFATKDGDGFGFFFIPISTSDAPLKVMCSPLGDGAWDHVSVSLPNRCATWKEMCFVKDLFFSEEDTVVQFHPKRTEYVDNHKFCLHLWKSNEYNHKLPPREFV